MKDFLFASWSKRRLTGMWNLTWRLPLATALQAGQILFRIWATSGKKNGLITVYGRLINPKWPAKQITYTWKSTISRIRTGNQEVDSSF